MDKIYRYIFCIVVLFFALFSSVGCFNFREETETKSEDSNLVVGEFELSDYSDELKEFPGDRVFGAIDTPEQAIEAAKEVWIEKLSAGDPINEEQIMVYYDKNSECWYICGSLPDIPNMIGSVPHAIIRKSDGKVLAVWGG